MYAKNYHSDGILKIHGRTHITGIELAESNKIFGGPDEICNTCIINLNNDESVVQIRYRQAINGPFGSVVRVPAGDNATSTVLTQNF